jgi:SAM-dependent methyltransferase
MISDDRPRIIAQEQFGRFSEQLRPLPLAERFDLIFQQNVWAAESSSGIGSTESETQILREALPELWQDLKVTSILDIPCGDFGWMSQLDLPEIRYVGADIVPDLIATHQKNYSGRNREFLVLDATRDHLPKVDLILCRDCLVHLSFDNVQRALDNFRRSGSKYLLTTHFVQQAANQEIEDGDWRPLNLQKAPFYLPSPQRILVEGCQEADGAFADKTLALWALNES